MAPYARADASGRCRDGATLGLAAAAALALSSAGCDVSLTTVSGTGPVVREARALTPATTAAPSEVRLVGELDLDVRVGPALAVFVEGHQDLLPHVLIRVDGGVVVVEVEEGLRLAPPPHIDLALPALCALSLAGPGSARVSGAQAPELDLSLAGSGDLTVDGTAGLVRLEAIGSGDVDLAGVRADEVVVDKVGSGLVRVQASRAVRGTLVGSGDLEWAGDGAAVEVDRIGSGEVRRAALAPR